MNFTLRQLLNAILVVLFLAAIVYMFSLIIQINKIQERSRIRFDEKVAVVENELNVLKLQMATPVPTLKIIKK
jgi:hypothetical protein